MTNHQRRIFASYDDIERGRMNLAFVLLLVIFMGLAALASAFYAGMEFESHLRKEAQRIEAMKPKRAQPASYTPLLSCTKEDRIEFARVCAARLRMGAVK